MEKNTYSLISSDWMFSNSTGNILIPYLLNILKGNEITSGLSKTNILVANSSGITLLNNKNQKTNKTESVAIIKIHHPIFKYDQNCGPSGTQTIISILDEFKSDKDIIGVVIDYNSGGGQSSGTRETALYIHNYPKPIVSYSNDIVGSAAYYMFSAGKYRMLNENADFVGCIGTMAEGVNLKGVIKKQGGEVYEIYSDLSPEKNLQSRKLEEGNDRPYIEKFLNPNAAKFQQDVKSFIPTISEKALLGDIFSPEDALQEGMIDGFGTLQDAINKVYELAQINNSNSNNKMTSKSLPAIEAVLGLEAPLAITDNGSFLNEGHETVNNRLVELQNENSTLKEQNKDTSALDTATTKLTEANQTISSVETSVDDILAKAGMAVEGSLTDKLNAISGKAEAFGKADSGKPTAPKLDGAAPTESKNDFVDMNAEHNQFIKTVLG